MSDHDPKLLNTARMAHRLGVTRAWLDNEACAGRIPSVRADYVRLYNPETVERLLAERASGKKEASA